MIKSENIATLAKALVKAQKNLGAAVKDAKNPYFKSNYADLSSVIDASVPVLNENGIAVLQVPTTENGKAVIRTMLLHESGEYITSDTDIVTAKQNDPQAYGSAISYARRYGLQAMVTLKAADDDGELSMGRNSTKASTPVVAPKAETKTDVEIVSTVAPKASGFGGGDGFGAKVASTAPKGFVTKGKLNGTATK